MMWEKKWQEMMLNNSLHLETERIIRIVASYRENLKEEEKVFLSLLKKELFDIEEPYDHEIDWNAVVEESIQQSCFLSAFSRYRSDRGTSF